MHLLKTYTAATHIPDEFHVYWTNSLVRAGGLLKVRIGPDMADRQMAAELSAIQYLLEDKRVLGNSLNGGPCIKLVVSQGAIRKLGGKRSGKHHLAPYSSFLITRLRGCQMEVSKKDDWFAGFSSQHAEHLSIEGPRRETVTIAGLGDVAISSHVLERLGLLFSVRRAEKLQKRNCCKLGCNCNANVR